MSTQGFVRRLRVAPPRMPGGEVNLAAPPEVPRAIPGNLMMRLMPFVMLVAVIGMIALMVTVGGRDMARNPMFLLFPMMMIMSMVGMFMGGGNRNGKAAAELNEERKDYFSYLANLREEADTTGAEQRTALEWSHPDPRALTDVVGTRRMWERRPSDADYCHIRVGIGTHRLATRLMAPETGPPEDLEPVSTVALRRFVKTHSVVHALPTAVSLRAFPTITFEGDRALARQLVRSMVLELCAFHGPDHVQVAVVTANPDGENWSWVKWLPHAQHSVTRDGMGSMRLLFPTLELMETALAAELVERGRFTRNAQPTQGLKQLVVVLDDGFVTGDEQLITDAGLDSVTLLDLNGLRPGASARRSLQLVVEGDDVAARTAVGVERFATPDTITVAEAETTARRIGRYRPANAAHIVSLEADSRAVDPGLMALLKIPDAAAIVPEQVWRQRSPRERLRVPIGITPNGQPIELDIKEAAEGGMGPHGLCIGATGSGKSEFLRTLVLSMITSHSPEQLNLVLVDFKGGATFLGLDGIAHIAAIITNLEDELTMVDRMRDALAGEMNRRQELLRAAGNFPNVTEYERARAGGADLEPLPALFIVVDEFSELLSQKPDFAELFVMIGRLGRSLHMHLLLASQRLEEGKLRGLDSHLSYRIGLKTFSAGESRSVLGVPDAYHLPSVPGSAFLKCDAAEPIRFNACYVSGEYVKPRVSARTGRVTQLGALAPKLFTATPVKKDPVPERVPLLHDVPEAEPVSSGPTKTTLLGMVVSRLRGHGRPAHEVWLPPLDDSPAVNELLPESDWSAPANVNGRLWMPMGVVDRPYDQRRDLLMVDLSGAQGNVAVVGGPQSGKSTALRTLILSAAATHTPEQLQFYCLDFGGGTLASLAKLPHVGGVAGRMDADAIRRTVAEVAGLLRSREQLFRELGIESMRDFRQRKAKGEVSQDKFGDVVLVIDGWASIKSDFEALDAVIQSLAIQGLSYGVHLAITASRWMEIRPAVKDMLGTRVELRLGDPIDSEVARRSAELVPIGRPGRGINSERLHILIALPRLDSSSTVEDLPAGVAGAVEAVRAHYGDREAPRVRMLPHDVDRDDVVKVARDAGQLSKARIAIGINEEELAPVVLDFDSQPHLVAFADTECGKTGLLRNIAAGVMENASPVEAKIILVDFRRSMLGVVPDEYLGGYATAPQSCTDLMTALAGALKDRLPPNDITQQQLKERSWWSGPDLFVMIDDYDLIPGGSLSHPLGPLVEYLPQARDIGLRVVVARRSGGAGRAMMDPIIGRLKDLSCNGLVMSGSRDEGGLFGGYKAGPMPPGRGMLVSRTIRSGVVQLSRMPDL
ncbi:type VII secretion protein EccCa [Mycolicibacterium fortuitum]|uniref:Type VII secretion protein EccCa n=2 Tax=Mycolicibacterium fortuitum TaxID=1766 RepID=A0AAE4VBL3_MYCFO|nr:type VII secretion protein EccCa [Mycolicibacterium fortuitum]MCV7140681.1 type VII secretion protein EccCa [Mycolicibacterium fortuitum]MDV7191930.1 type VII secretion protein EccCa [Mycolicibacterium fortuitum]MDV7203642.1 type VII secretion protein EccCa [Mycolicibacterium fortuitum]MDV7226040.1 type VII secretion protein EccCa [Mycolicibacterium fortuitum]MDV7258529.1 type VII secretion protein EccCa [Mycolicibacterium fortuitum]